ncbi:MAG: J domain-containing protein [Treponema sp.]
MSDDFYETIGRILSDSFSNDRDPFDVANKRTSVRRTIRRNENETNIETEMSNRVAVPNELIEDFAILNVLPGVPLEDCKHAWKVLLKRVHPDVSEVNGEKTSDLVIRINNSYRRIETWFNTGKIIK